MTDNLIKIHRVERVAGVNVAHAANNHVKFENLRAELFWTLRELFLEGKMSIPDNPRLIEQLSDIQYFFTKKGRIQIEAKSDIKSRTGESPDLADALAISYAGGNIVRRPDEPADKPQTMRTIDRIRQVEAAQEAAEESDLDFPHL